MEQASGQVLQGLDAQGSGQVLGLDAQASGQVLGLDSQGNMLFRLVKPVMGIFHHTTTSTTQQEHANSMGQVGMALQGLADHTMVQVHHQVHQVQGHMVGSEVMTQTHPHVQGHMQPHMEAHMQVSDSGAVQQSAATMEEEEEEEEEEDMMPASLSPQRPQQVTHMPFAEVSSLLDPNMKGSKARKYLISYDEIKRRLQSPEKMSLRSLAAYTRVSRGPASKKSLLESLNVLGLTPSTTTAVSSSFSKLTEGDTKALCDDMKDFAHDYVDYGSMAKQLIPDQNTVQHWSKIIETKNHLDDMRRCFGDPGNSGAFHNVTHGLGLGMLGVALDMVTMVIDRQIRILSGAAASDPADPGPPMRRVRRRLRKPRPPGATDNNNGVLDGGGDNKLHRTTSSGGVAVGVKTASKAKGGRGGGGGGAGGGGRSRKKARLGCGGSAGGAGAAATVGLAVGPSQTNTLMTTAMNNNNNNKAEEETTMENSVLTLVSVGYEAISTGLSLTATQSASINDT